ncbi:MAG: hypothetical protein ACW99Q_07410 [Candidatus Kariarchaeaceae archaeon]|jgi:hypothetical protein
MENKELYEISNFRIFTSILAIIFLFIVFSSVVLDYFEFPFGSIIIKLIILFAFIVAFIILNTIFTVDDLPLELNNLVVLVLLGLLIYIFLVLLFPIISLGFGLVYALYFISKIDENNKILYNRFSE